MRLMIEVQRAIWELPVAVVKELINGAGENEFPVFHLFHDVAVISIQEDANIGMSEHSFEHPGVAMPGHRLELVGEVAIIAAGTHGNARGDACVEIAGVDAPLLARVVPKELLVQIFSDPIHDDIAGGLNFAWLRDAGKELLNFLAAQIHAVQLVERVCVDGHGDELSIDACEDAMLVRAPLGESRQVFEDAFGVGMEDVRPVFVNKNACVVIAVIRIAADVVSLINNENARIELRGKPLGQYATCKSRANNELIKHTVHFARWFG
jgi:hypothetical protein